MEKISKIVPASPRMKAVDLSRSQPVRPGVPRFGRLEGRNSIADQKREVLLQESQKVADRVDFSFSRMEKDKNEEAIAPMIVEDKVEIGGMPVDNMNKTYKDSNQNKQNKIVENISKQFFANPKSEVRESDKTKSEEVLGLMDQKQKEV